MATFPTLKTGAVAQYPAKLTFIYRADIVAFLDGSEQRFRNSPSVLHQWQIALTQLDEQELASIELFFISNQGGADTFTFVDPWSQTTYPACSISRDDILMSFAAPLSSGATLLIRENRVT